MHQKLLLVLLLSCSCFAGILFHSNFESERMYSAKALKPGAKKIELLYNPDIPKWFPKDGGKGIAEPIYPRNREVFSYTSRDHNVLMGVTEIRNTHSKWVEIRTSGLQEWFSDNRSQQLYGKGQITMDSMQPISGTHSARISCNTQELALIWSQIPEPTTGNLHAQFRLRCSNNLLSDCSGDLPVFHGRLGPIGLPRISFIKKTNGEGMILGLLGSPDIQIIRSRKLSEIPLHPKTIYAVEVHYQTVSPNQIQTTLWLDGAMHAQSRSRHRIYKSESFTVSIGKAGTSSSPGHFWVDDIVVADAKMEAMLSPPKVIFRDHALRTGESHEKGNLVAAHWQIAKNNSWLLPVFSSGLDSRYITYLPSLYHTTIPESICCPTLFENPVQIPFQVQPGKAYLARVCLKPRHGPWSVWSEPCEFVIPPEGPKPSEPETKVLDTYFTLPGAIEKLQRVPKGKWLDLHVRFTPLEQHSFLDVLFTGNPENYPGNHLNRGGAFNPCDNYAITFSLRTQRMWAKQDSGKGFYTSLLGTKGLYCDDSTGLSVFNAKAGIAKTRIRLLEKARPGTWKIMAFASQNRREISPFFQSLFFVETFEESVPAAASERKLRRLAFAAISLGCLCLLFGALWLRGMIREHRRRLAKQPSLGNEPGPLQSKRIQLANEYIQRDYEKPISLKEVAEAVGVSPTWLSFSYKQATGKNILQCINDLRIQKAKELLGQSGLSVTEIAFKVGFNSIRNFNRTFKQIVGKSPVSFRASSIR